MSPQLSPFFFIAGLVLFIADTVTCTPHFPVMGFNFVVIGCLFGWAVKD